MKILKLSLFLAAFLSNLSFACDVTLSAGNNVISAAVNAASAGAEICLNTGNYSESYTINLKASQKLRGLGTSNQDTKLFSGASTVINFSAGASVENFKLTGVSLPYLGLYIANANNVSVSNLVIEYVHNAIHIANSDSVEIIGVYTNDNGANNSAPDPSIYVVDSDYVEVYYGSYVGRSNGVGGDGEIACKDSHYMSVEGTHVAFSGAAGMYFVNCDNATVTNAIIHSGDEWGLDVVDGSSNFTATGNTINYNFWGAIIFDEADNGSGTFTNNTFNWNNTSGDVDCQGIVIIGNVNNVTQSGNSATPNPVICPL